MRCSSLVLAALMALPAMALEVPSGAEMEIRLKTKVSTQTAKPGDRVEAITIAPMMAAGEFAAPAGALVTGVVQTVVNWAASGERARLGVNFTEIEIGGKKIPFAARVSAVDNARESVDEQGQILGIVPAETITGRLDTGLERLAEKYAGFAGVLSTAKNVVLKPADGSIDYDPGIEITLKLTAPLTLEKAGGPGPALKAGSFSDETALLEMVSREPFRTVAQNPPSASDITNIILIGTAEQVQQAFAAAGWSSAAVLNTQAKFETFRAIAENRGYREAPVSILLLDSKPPDMVFQKMNNTFAKRHHLRVWRRSVTFQGKPVWAVAATHDTGITFSEENRTFIHTIDSAIDRERAKVVNDLILTENVAALALVERPKVPQKSQNATGDNLETDGNVAVLLLN